MKINTFTAILSVALAGILAFFLSFYFMGVNKMLLAIGSFLSMTLSLVGTVSLSFEYDRTTALTRTTSGIFMAILLTSQIIFTVLNSFSIPTYVLVTGGITILYALTVYGISRSKH